METIVRIVDQKRAKKYEQPERKGTHANSDQYIVWIIGYFFEKKLTHTPKHWLLRNTFTLAASQHKIHQKIIEIMKTCVPRIVKTHLKFVLRWLGHG